MRKKENRDVSRETSRFTQRKFKNVSRETFAAFRGEITSPAGGKGEGEAPVFR
jgi:hypothetical protein